MKHNENKVLVLVLLTVFATSMGYLETSVAYYERSILGMPPSYNLNVLPLFPPKLLIVEQLREIATIIMLFTVGLLVGKSIREKIAVFLFCFGIWDIAYYIFYYAIIQWPTSLFTIDLLFLVPAPWTAPIIVPVVISAIMIIISTYVIIKKG